jgi:hypothetical protein
MDQTKKFQKDWEEEVKQQIVLHFNSSSELISEENINCGSRRSVGPHGNSNGGISTYTSRNSVEKPEE